MKSENSNSTAEEMGLDIAGLLNKACFFYILRNYSGK